MMLNDIARELARHVPLTKLVQLDGDVCPYLASLMIAALNKAGDELVVPDTLRIRKLTEEAFDNLLKAEAGRTYDNYRTIAKALVGTKAKDKPLTAAETDRLQQERLNEVLGEVARVLEKLNEDDDSDNDASDTGFAKMIAPVMTKEDAVRVTTAVVQIAKKIEENVRKVVTAASASQE
jgi:hypothetical protein